jgi:hypothetical protein
MASETNWRPWLVRVVLVLWGLQVVWLAWHFGPEARKLAQMTVQSRAGQALRQEDLFYRWVQELAGAIPLDATYVFLDDYEAGKEIEVRYHLTPRRHILLPPDVPPSFLFYVLQKKRATFLIIRQGDKPLGPGAQAAVKSPVFSRVNLPGPGLVFRVDYAHLQGGLYD